MGPCCGHLALTPGYLAPSCAILGPSWGQVGPSWGHLGPSSGHLGAIFDHLGPSWGLLGAKLGHLEAILGHLGTILGHLGAKLGHFGSPLGISWNILAPSGPIWRQPLASRALTLDPKTSCIARTSRTPSQAVQRLPFWGRKCDQNCDRSTRPRQLHDRIDLLGGPVMRRRRLSIRPPKGPC